MSFEGIASIIYKLLRFFDRKLIRSITVHALFSWYFIIYCFPWRNSPYWVNVLFVEDSWSHSDTPHSVGLLWTNDQSDAENSLHLTEHNTHRRKASMPPAGFESTVLASERPKTHALHRAFIIHILLYFNLRCGNFSSSVYNSRFW